MTTKKFVYKLKNSTIVEIYNTIDNLPLIDLFQKLDNLPLECNTYEVIIQLKEIDNLTDTDIKINNDKKTILIEFK